MTLSVLSDVLWFDSPSPPVPPLLTLPLLVSRGGRVPPGGSRSPADVLSEPPSVFVRLSVGADDVRDDDDGCDSFDVRPPLAGIPLPVVSAAEVLEEAAAVPRDWAGVRSPDVRPESDLETAAACKPAPILDPDLELADPLPLLVDIDDDVIISAADEDDDVDIG